MPGRNGVPLVHVLRDNDDANIVPNVEMLDDYINRAPLEGEGFTVNASEVHTYIVIFTAGEIAESKLLSIADQSNSRLDMKALREHYEGVGINAIAIRDADNVILVKRNQPCGRMNLKESLPCPSTFTKKREEESVF